MQTSMLIGLRIKELRKRKGLTQEELAEKVELDGGYISKLEVGRNYPTIKTLEKIAKILDVELSEFFKFTNDNNKNFKEEINKIYDKLTNEKRYTLYRVAKDLLI